MSEFKESQCACTICQMMCMHPCWPTPDEAKRLIEAGYGKRLELQIESYAKQTLYVIAPRKRGHWCTFNSERGLCVLHKKGLKPLEGRLASCKREVDGQTIRNHVAEFWANDEARNMAVEFHVKQLHGR